MFRTNNRLLQKVDELKCIENMLYYNWCLSLLLVMGGYRADGFTATNCEGLTCKNGGTVTYSDGICSCLCPENTTGLLCDSRLQESAFPKGPFVLPMSKDGCAEELSHGWSTGFINITTTFPFDKRKSYHKSCGPIAKVISAYKKKPFVETYILGPFDRYTIQMNFCFKTNDHPFNNDVDWPPGDYGIYGTEEGCPPGFAELFLSLCLPPLLHYNMDGSLPRLTVEKSNDFAVINVTYCRRRTERDETEERRLSFDSPYPFLLLKGPETTSESCQMLAGYVVSEENYPIPLPAVLSNGSTIFQLSYCRYVPDTFGIAEQRRQIDSCTDVEVWVMIDAGSTMQVSGVMWSDEDMNKENETYIGRATNILVGNKPWSFIHYGALVCEFECNRTKTNVSLPSLTEVYTCSRSILGRYITMVFRSTHWFDSNIFSDVVIYILSNDADVALGTTGCSQTMGMQTLYIQDVQITASSYQLPTPPSSARLHLSGWCAQLEDEHPYIQVDVGMVTIINGVTISNWIRYRHTYFNNTYQEFIEYLGATSFFIEYGTSVNLLRRYNKKEFVYDRSQPIDVPQTFLLQMPFLARYVRLYPKQRSHNEITCLKFELLGCRIDLRQPTTNALKVSKDWRAVLSADLRTFDEVLATFSNDGFPTLQRSNTVVVWRIRLLYAYVRLHFGYIHLRKPTKSVESVFLNNKRCQDTIFISTAMMQNPFVDPQKLENYIQLDSRYNNRVPYFIPTKYLGGSVYLTFFVCSAHDKESGGAAFRVHILTHNHPVCTHECFETHQMELTTDNFFGQIDDPNRQYYWEIQAQRDVVKALFHIKDFDISCFSDSLYYINSVRYCNQNVSLAEQNVWLSFDYDNTYIASVIVRYDRKNTIPDEINVFPEGFRLTYEVIFFYQEAELHFDFWKACSTKYRKCYFAKTANTKSWIDIAHKCKNDHSLLVSIKSFEEQKAVRTLVQYFYNDFSGRYVAVEMDTFIGLSRYVDSSGRLKEHWTDGTPPSYTAWDENEPAESHIKRCTMMNFLDRDYGISWFTTPCSLIIEQETIYVCEERLERTETSDEFVDFSENWFVQNAALPMDPAMMFKCSSGEWMSHMVRCNGFRECKDASDEKDCIKVPDTCKENEFKCTDGQCIHVSQVCDHHADCLDSVDEYCSFPVCNETDQFTCNSGQCILLSQRCDSDTDCVDGSDEISCASCNPEKAFQCGDTSCIPKRFVCDKLNDCPNGLDERSCDRKYSTCDDILRAGLLVNGEEYTVDRRFHINCDLDMDSGIMKMNLLNFDWKLDGKNFRVIPPLNSINSAEKDGYACLTKIWKDAHRERKLLNKIENIWYDLEEETFFHLGFSTKSFTSNSIYAKTYQELENPLKVGEPLPWEHIIYTLSHYLITLKDTFNPYKNRLACLQECHKEVDTKQESLVYCGRGVDPVSQEKQCMYAVDHSGVIEGCRSRNHLQNCEHFVCPRNHFKCMKAYCIPPMYVCNGYIDCPHGEDEQVCSCKNSEPYVIGILVPSSSYITIQRADVLYESAFKLGASLYTRDRKIYVLKVSKGQGQYLIKIVSTLITSKSEHVTNIYLDYAIKDNDNILKVLFDRTNTSIGLVWISDDAKLNDAERYLSEKLPNTTTNVTMHRVVIDKHIKADVHYSHAANGDYNEITLENVYLLGSLGATLFPELCKEQMLRCLGHFRCKLSMVCIPLVQVCDGKKNCPFGDDEDYCNFKCPEVCSCAALILNCSKAHINNMIDISPETRVIDASYTHRLGVAILKDQMYRLPMLTKLNVSNCDLEEISDFSFQNMQNLLTLDISYNKFRKLSRDIFVSLIHLQTIYLTGCIHLKEIEPGAFNGLLIKSLSINHANIKTLFKNTFAGLQLTVLDLSDNKLETIENLAFNALEAKFINIENNEITEFSDRMFEGVKNMDSLKTSSFKFCCVKPPYLSEDNCYPPKDEFSSCEHLMRNTTLKALLWTIGFLSLIGNVLSIIYRLVYDKSRLKLGYGIFVTNLGISDLLMGFYMLTIATADKVFEGSYIEFDEEWKKSGWCQFAGILSTLSSEASVLFMIFITVDRILVIKYPFGDIRFTTRSAVITAIGCWTLAFIIALFPVLFEGYFKNFYGKSAVCLALPLTRDRPSGWIYSISIFIGFNMVTVILIATGQWLIYKEIKKNARIVKGRSTARTNDLKIARNLLLLVLTDFMCWFPIGFMGVLSLAGHDIPGVIYAWTAVLILPINSALNPFLYTFMTIIGRKKFTPSVTEQANVDNMQVSGDAVLKIIRFTRPQAKWRNSLTLAEILQEKNLTVIEIVVLVHNVIKYLAVLEEHGLKLPTINHRQILLHLDEENHVKRKVIFTGKPEQCMKKIEHADKIGTFGMFLERLLSTLFKD